MAAGKRIWSEALNLSPRIQFGLLLLGASLLIIGIALLCSAATGQQVLCSNAVPSVYSDNTFIIDYTNCTDERTEGKPQERTCSSTFEKEYFKCTCLVIFNLTQDLLGDVYAYYELTDFHKKYTSEFINSRDTSQLSGNLAKEPKDLAKECNIGGNNTVKNDNGILKMIAPCGAMANIMFNDTFEIIRPREQAALTKSDKIISVKDKEGFKNPPQNGNLTLRDVFANYTNPKNWVKNIWELSDAEGVSNNGFENEYFIAWMREDWVRKPMWRLDRSNKGYENGLLKGQYGLRIMYDYPPAVYNGPRKFVISNCGIHQEVSSSQSKLVIGWILLILGIIILIPAAVIVVAVYRRKINVEGRRGFSPTASDVNEKDNKRSPAELEELPINE